MRFLMTPQCHKRHFVNLKGAQESIRGIHSASLCSLAGRYVKHAVVVPARLAGNRFLGSLKGLQIRAQDSHHYGSAELANSEPGGTMGLCPFQLDSILRGQFVNGEMSIAVDAVASPHPPPPHFQTTSNVCRK